MIFKDLKQNSIIYLLNSKNITLEEAIVLNISLPHLDTHYTQPNEMVIDITLEIDGHSKLFTMKENSEVCYNDSLMITPNKNTVLTEIYNIKLKNENILELINEYKDIVNKCLRLLRDNDPIYKERLENDARINNLEESLKEIKESLKLILSSK